MAKNKGVRVTILVEDQMLARFVRSVLEQIGYCSREIYEYPYPKAENTKAWVARKYPDLVKAHRSKAAYQQVALLIGTDADNQSVQKRSNDLQNALSEKGYAPRQVRERIALWIPKWHVETWIRFLSGEQVVESQRYKRETKYSDFNAVGKAFVEKYREFRMNPNLDALPSLITAFQETKRID